MPGQIGEHWPTSQDYSAVDERIGDYAFIDTPGGLAGPKPVCTSSFPEWIDPA